MQKLFADPNNFFKDASKEKSYWEVLRFFVVVYVFATIIQLIVSIPINKNLFGNQIFAYLLATLVISIIYAFIGPFIAGVIAHLGILILVRGRSFFSTFKAITYGLIVMTGYGVLAYLIMSIMYLASPNSADISGFIIDIITIIGVVHMLIAETIGVSRYHSISKGKAFFGIILIPLIILIIFIAMGGFANYSIV
ncbi:YIP1 family protein [Candidatus Woesearchaeota archaeon]|nr:YIP1 family protein [Candidatus Woesearchaeota archaeon]